MRVYVESDSGVEWNSGKGISRDSVVGSCYMPLEQSHVRKYNKLGSFFGVNFVAKKDQYEIGRFGNEGGYWAFNRKGDTNKAAFDKCYKQAIEQRYTSSESGESGESGDGSGWGLEENYRTPTSGRDFPLEFIIGGVLFFATIIYAVK